MRSGLDGSILTVNEGRAVLALFGGSSEAITQAAGAANRPKAAVGTPVNPKASGLDNGTGNTAAVAGGGGAAGSGGVFSPVRGPPPAGGGPRKKAPRSPPRGPRPARRGRPVSACPSSPR